MEKIGKIKGLIIANGMTKLMDARGLSPLKFRTHRVIHTYCGHLKAQWGPGFFGVPIPRGLLSPHSPTNGELCRVCWDS